MCVCVRERETERERNEFGFIMKKIVVALSVISFTVTFCLSNTFSFLFPFLFISHSLQHRICLNNQFSHSFFSFLFLFFCIFWTIFLFILWVSSPFNPGGSYSGRATTSYSCEGLIAEAKLEITCSDRYHNPELLRDIAGLLF